MSSNGEGPPGSHAGTAGFHEQVPSQPVENRAEETSLADAGEAQHTSESRKDPPIRRLLSEDRRPQRSPRGRAKATKDLENSLDTIIDGVVGHWKGTRWPRNQEESEFSRQYYESFQGKEKNTVLKQARRNQLVKERHGYDEETAWLQILELLQKESPRGAHRYVKRMETIRFPQGISAKWSGDAGESILEITLRTGSHVQTVSSGPNPTTFSSLKLWGKPDQNKAAKRMLQDSDLLQVVCEDNLNASTSLADYVLHSEVSKRHGEAKPAVGPDGALLGDDTSTNDASRLHGAKDGATEELPPTRSNWSYTRLRNEGAWIGQDRSWKSDMFPQTQEPGGFMTAASLANRIEHLSRQNIRKRHAITRNQQKLVELLTRPENASHITPSAVASAFRFLAKHMFFPSIRSILTALEDTRVEVTAEVFVPLLTVAAMRENVMAFHNVVHIMRKRAVIPDSTTWVAFHTMTLKRFPHLADKVISGMHARGMTLNPETKVRNVEEYANDLFEAFAQAHPGATIEGFVENLDRDIPGGKWLTTFTVNKICHSLLKRGQIQLAYDLVDELVARGGRPSTVTLNTFLSAAKRDRSLEMAVATLRKFHNLHAKSRPLAKRKDIKVFSRTHDLQIAVNETTLKHLLRLSWSQRQYNRFRVFWRFAACTGLLNTEILGKVHRRIVARSALDFPRDNPSLNDSRSPRRRMWDAWAARFAIGVHSGLMVDDTAAGDVAPAIEQSTRSSKAASPDDDVEGSTAFGTQVEKPVSPQRAHRQRLLEIYSKDVEHGQDLRPLETLVRLADEAQRRDEAWHVSLLGTPKGLAQDHSGEGMFDAMLLDAVDVPVEVRDPQKPIELRQYGIEVPDEAPESEESHEVSASEEKSEGHL